MSNLFILCLEFFKTGLLAVGGGLATVPFLNEMSIKYNWFSVDTLSTMIAISESTPGPMGVNMATYVGYEVAGILGSVVATLSLVAPSIIVISVIAGIIEKFKSNKYVNMIFYGLRAATVALIISATLPIFKLVILSGNSINLINVLCVLILIFAYKKFKLHPIAVIVISAIAGMLV